MRSGEVARLAGVTVRALRHYHRIGVLPEPSRGGNGYREYRVGDLVRVLRIRRLASLGIPLERTRALLDDPRADGGEVLDELDAELAEQIERLTRQREVIGRLRRQGAAPDLPPELAPFLAAFAAAGASPDLARIDRDQAVLLAHLVGEKDMPHLERLYERLADPAVVPAVAELSERFFGIGPSSSEGDKDQLVDTFMETFSAVVGDDAREPIELADAAGVFSAYVSDLLNPQQWEIIEELQRRIDEAADDAGNTTARRRA